MPHRWLSHLPFEIPSAGGPLPENYTQLCFDPEGHAFDAEVRGLS